VVADAVRSASTPGRTPIRRRTSRLIDTSVRFHQRQTTKPRLDLFEGAISRHPRAVVPARHPRHTIAAISLCRCRSPSVPAFWAMDILGFRSTSSRSWRSRFDGILVDDAPSRSRTSSAYADGHERPTDAALEAAGRKSASAVTAISPDIIAVFAAGEDSCTASTPAVLQAMFRHHGVGAGVSSRCSHARFVTPMMAAILPHATTPMTTRRTGRILHAITACPHGR